MNGKLADAITSDCSWVALNPNACADCELNPESKPQASPRLIYLFYLSSLQATGAVFNVNQLRLTDWQDLLLLKVEQLAFDKERWKNNSMFRSS